MNRQVMLWLQEISMSSHCRFKRRTLSIAREDYGQTVDPSVGNPSYAICFHLVTSQHSRWSRPLLRIGFQSHVTLFLLHFD